MVSKALRPGGSIGVEAVLREQFKVSPVPNIGWAAAVRRVHDRLAPADAPRCKRLDVSDAPIPRGALFDMSGARVPFPQGERYDRSFVALVDPDPGLGWAHRAYWAFVPAGGEGDVVLQETDLPEHANGRVRMLLVPLS